MTQKVETRVATKDVNPEWDEDLTILNPNESHPVSLIVYDDNKLSDEKMGEAEFDIGPLVQAAKINPNGLPNDTIVTRILPSSSNCLAKESSIFWEDGVVKQDMRLRLKNVECGEIEIQIRWIF
ncbi:hypothetical protein MIMGU_mgv1a018724mg [Erythranthe guttata]|uniref:C2 domain-containing protein n=1 Tax=Erythranthe guttata TaxID=4155 RepID=A0A022QIT5_ERYGU|nr:hypothetical protein MIMGU_mgv1a018724mg [Erythranthe guttata]